MSEASPPTMPYLDHLALGVETWPDGFAQLAGQFGGRWSHGADVGDFAPAQLVYDGGMRLELISPGARGDGFVRRFLDQFGPGPHHVTFRVADLDDTLDRVHTLGIASLPGKLEVPQRSEAFLHPKAAGLGTLIQFVQSDDTRLPSQPMPLPVGFPLDTPPALAIAWIGMSVASVDRAEQLFVRALDGTVVDCGTGWRLLAWGPARRLLIREGAATPGGAHLWPSSAGVAHVVFGSPELGPGHGELSANMLDPRVGLRTWTAVDALHRPCEPTHLAGGYS